MFVRLGRITCFLQCLHQVNSGRILTVGRKVYMSVMSNGAESMVAKTSRLAVERRVDSLRAKNRCERCWMSNVLCVCQPVSSLWKDVQRPRTRIALFFHYKEFGRASNTGKLMQIGMDAPSFVLGNPNDEKALNELLASCPSAVLFPSASSVSLETWKSDNIPLASADFANNPPLLCVLDGTWTQAASMNRAISPLIPRVKLDALISKPSEFLSRKQNSETRISTIEAAALALAELGEDKEIVECLTNSLRLSVDALLIQGGRTVAFGSDIRPNVDKAVDGPAPYTPPSVLKPTTCPNPLCSAPDSVPPKGFKNLGIRRPWDMEGNKRGKTSYRVWRCTSCCECFNQDLVEP